MSTLNFTSGAAENVTASPQRRWQFSLRATLLIIALVVVVISHIKTTLDLQEARRTVEQQAIDIDLMRGELGIFEIEDPSKVHVLFIRLNQPDAYRYRVYLPPRKREYEICVGTQGVTLSGLPDDRYQFQPLRAGGVVPVDGRSFFVDVFLAKDANGEHHWHVRHPRGELLEPFTPFATGGQSHVSAGNSAGRVIHSDPNEPIILVRWTPSDNFAGTSSEGLAVWIR